MGAVGHQHAVAAGQRHIGGQRGPFVAALLLDHLDQQNLTALDDLLNLVAAAQAAWVGAAGHRLLDLVVAGDLLDLLVVVVVGGTGRGFGGLVVLGGQFGARGGLLGQQRLAVGQRDLVVVGVDFVERQESVAVAAIFDERRLQRRFHARHLGKIDVALKLFLVG